MISDLELIDLLVSGKEQPFIDTVDEHGNLVTYVLYDQEGKLSMVQKNRGLNIEVETVWVRPDRYFWVDQTNGSH